MKAFSTKVEKDFKGKCFLEHMKVFIIQTAKQKMKEPVCFEMHLL